MKRMAPNRCTILLFLHFQANFAVFSRVNIEHGMFLHHKIQLANLTVTSFAVDIGTCSTSAHEQWGFQSIEEALEQFDLLCYLLQQKGYYRMEIAWENAEQLQNVHYLLHSQLNGIVLHFLKCSIDQYMPLGVPHAQQIQWAEETLMEISRTLSNRLINPIRITHLSNRHYEMIPHSSGRNSNRHHRKQWRPLLNSDRLLYGRNEYIKRLFSLVRAINGCVLAGDENPLDYIYHNYLRVNLMPVEYGSCSYRQFLADFGFVYIPWCIQQVFYVHKLEWANDFRNDIGNDHYLFHSTHLANSVNILRDGLQSAPAHVFSYNRWAGKGIYFHGSVDAAHAYASQFNHNVILVCRVALGCIKNIDRCMFIKDPDYEYPLQSNQDSLRQLGQGCAMFQHNRADNAFYPVGTQMR